MLRRDLDGKCLTAELRARDFAPLAPLNRRALSPSLGTHVERVDQAVVNQSLTSRFATSSAAPAQPRPAGSQSGLAALSQNSNALFRPECQPILSKIVARRAKRSLAF
jgi:hypothetical protein